MMVRYFEVATFLGGSSDKLIVLKLWRAAPFKILSKEAMIMGQDQDQDQDQGRMLVRRDQFLLD